MTFIKEFVTIFESPANNGTCYVDAYRYFMDNYSKDKNLRLVHTLVDGQGALDGIRYNHAFLVSGNTVIDPSQPGRQKFPKNLYYTIGNINTKSKEYFEYTFDDVIKKSGQYGTYGPWEKVLLQNKY